MVGDPIETAKGYQVNLQRINYPAITGEEMQQVQVDVEFQENERLRIKVRLPCSSQKLYQFTLRKMLHFSEDHGLVLQLYTLWYFNIS